MIFTPLLFSAGRITAIIRSISAFIRNTGFAYNKFGQVSNVKITGTLVDISGTNTYDSLGRLTKKQWTTGSNQNYTSYSYKPGANGSASTLIDTITFGSGTSTVKAGRQYVYDDVGNITLEKQRQTTGSYTDAVEDVAKSATVGGFTNATGLVFSKVMATAKVNEINNMPRFARKVYLRNNIYGNSQAKANMNLKTFGEAHISANIKLIESQITIFRVGVYATISSTITTNMIS